MRRHAFRPAAPAPLEGRLAAAAVSPFRNPAAQIASVLAARASTSSPAPVFASNLSSSSALAAKAARQQHARAVAQATKSKSIDWNKLADQVKTFFFGHSKTTHVVAKPKATANTLLR